MKTKARGQTKQLIKALAVASAIFMHQGAYAHVGSHLVGGKAKIVTLKLDDFQGGLRSLVSEGFDIAGVDVENGTADVVIGENSLTELTSLGIGKMMDSKIIDPTAAPDAGYTTYEELTRTLNEYKSRFPSIMAIQSIGRSHEGRDIWAVKISSNVDASEGKPVVFFNAMHHAREVMTTEIALDIIEQLTSGYATNARTQNWVNSNEIWIVPMVNPDGNNRVWTSNNMWRKNMRGGYGVDINRNYPYAWGSCNGSSGNTGSDTYRGPSAGSEPETQAMMGLVAQIKPALSISYHSYSELVIYPYGCDGEYTPDRETVAGIGHQLASRLPKDGASGTYTPGTSWEILYAVDGGDIDWYYHEHGVLPYVIEVNSGAQGFQPPYSWRQRTVEKNRAGWGYMIDRLAKSGIKGTISIGGQRVTEGVLTLTTVGGQSTLGNAVRTFKVKPDGTFHVIVDPGMYTLSATVGGQVIEQNVVVGAERSDIALNL